MPSRRSFLSMLAGLVVVPSLAPARRIVTSIRGRWDAGLRGIVDDGTELPTIYTCKAPTGAQILRKNMTITFRDWDDAIDGPRS